MPTDPLVTSAIIGAGSSFLGSAFGYGANANMNRKNRKWQEKMYARQLADERENWNMQNEYNEEMYNKYSSPSAQAQQMLSAGINPDLQDVAASAPAAAGDIGNASVPSVSGQNPYDFVGAFINIAELVQGLESQQLQNQLTRAELDKVSKSYAMDYLVKTYNPELDKSPLVGHSDVMNDTIKASKSVGDLSSYFRSQGLSRRAANLAARFVHTTNVEDVRSEYYSRKHSSEVNRRSYLSDVADPLYNDKDKPMIKSLNDLLSRKSELDKFIDQARKAKAGFDRDYYSAKDGRRVANSEQTALDESNRAMKQANDRNENSATIDANFNKWVSNIKNPLEQLVCRVLYNMLSNFSISGAFSQGLRGSTKGFSVGIR